MEKINKHRLALALGSFVALVHVIWSLLVASGMAEPLARLIMSLHMIREDVVILPFNLGSAIMLVIVTFLVGYIVGWIFASIWNVTKKR